MRAIRRFSLLLSSLSLAGAVLLAGCERKPEPQPEPGPLRYALDGTWAWASEVNCYDNGNTIVFALPRIQVFEDGESQVEIARARVQEAVYDGKPLLIVRYKLMGRKFEERYLALDASTLQPLDTEVNGKPQISAGSDKRLLRCPAEALVPTP